MAVIPRIAGASYVNIQDGRNGLPCEAVAQLPNMTPVVWDTSLTSTKPDVRLVRQAATGEVPIGFWTTKDPNRDVITSRYAGTVDFGPVLILRYFDPTSAGAPTKDTPLYVETGSLSAGCVGTTASGDSIGTVIDNAGNIAFRVKGI
jgi:hypothetical protein